MFLWMEQQKHLGSNFCVYFCRREWFYWWLKGNMAPWLGAAFDINFPASGALLCVSTAALREVTRENKGGCTACGVCSWNDSSCCKGISSTLPSPEGLGTRLFCTSVKQVDLAFHVKSKTTVRTDCWGFLRPLYNGEYRIQQSNNQSNFRVQ